MKQINKITLFALCLLCSLAAMGQTEKKETPMNRTVVVEKEYNPDIMDASKVNVLPKVQDPTVAKKAIEYNTSLLPFASLNYPMQPSLMHLDQQKYKAGYARLGYGTNGNLDAKVAYLFHLSDKDQLGVLATLDGMNTKIKVPSFIDNKEKIDWQSRYYSSALNVNYQHLFDKYTFDAAVSMGLDNFNYQAIGNNISSSTLALSDKQRHSKWMFHTGLKSLDKNLPLQFAAETNILSFQQAYPNSKEENIWQIKADVSGSLSQEQTVGVVTQMDNFFYSADGFKNYSSLTFNPYYRYVANHWDLRLGAHVDFSLGPAKGLEVSPDLLAQYVFSNSYVAYAQLGGGRVLNDFRRIESLSPYVPFLQYDNSYTQLDFKLGLKSYVGGGFWFDVFSGYQSTSDDLCIVGNLPRMVNADTKHFYLGSVLKYKFKDIIDVSMKEKFYSWENESDAILEMKPKFDFQLDVAAQILPQLTANMNYQYVSRPEVKLAQQVYVKQDPINELGLGATYRLYKELSLFGKLNNLLNKSYQNNYSYPTQGIHFLIGASIRF